MDMNCVTYCRWRTGMRGVSGPSEAVMVPAGDDLWYPVTVAGRRSEQELWRKSCREN